MYNVKNIIKPARLYSVILGVAAAILIASCQSGGTTPSTTPANGLTAPATYAYITNFGNNSYTQCSVGTSGIESDSCHTVIPKLNGIDALSGPQGIAFDRGYAYFVNSSNNSYTQCNVGATGIESSTCNTILLANLAFPIDIAISGNYAYFTNSNDASYTQCNVGTSGIESLSCVENTPLLPNSNNALNGPYGIAFNGSNAYIVNSASNNYAQCTVNAAGINTCTEASQISPGALSNPGGIAFDGNYAYFSNSANHSYTQCSVNTSGIVSSQCNTTIPLDQNGGYVLNGSYGVKVNGNYAYFTNSNSNSYTKCKVDIVSGIESSQCVVTTPHSPGDLNSPSGIAFVTP